MYSGAAVATAVALTTAVLTYLDKIYVYRDASAILIVSTVAVAATWLLGLIVSRKIFSDIRLQQRSGASV